MEERSTEISETHQMKERFNLLYGIPEGKSKTTGWERTEGADFSQHMEMLLSIQVGGVCARPGTAFVIATGNYNLHWYGFGGLLCILLSVASSSPLSSSERF